MLSYKETCGTFWPDTTKAFLFLFFSLHKAVRDAMHKAFWDILESELNDDPPVFGHAIRLLEEIREVSSNFPVIFSMPLLL